MGHRFGVTHFACWRQASSCQRLSNRSQPFECHILWLTQVGTVKLSALCAIGFPVPPAASISSPLGSRGEGSLVTGKGESLRMLGLVVKSVPGIIIVGREHMPGLETTDKIVMAVEIPVAANLNEPGTTAGATSHIARNGNH